MQHLGLASTALTALALPLVVHAQTAGSPYTTGYRWDGDRRIVGVISPDPDGATTTLVSLAKRYTYDSDGLLTKTEEGRLAAWQPETVLPVNWVGFTVIKTTELAYDAGGRVVRQIVRGSDNAPVSVTQKSYDAADRVECTAARMNPTVFASLLASPPASPSIAACNQGDPGTDGPDRITKSVYDAKGQEVQIRRAVGTGIEQAYVTYGYTANGLRKYVIDANGNRGRYAFDGYDRTLQWQFPSATRPTAYNDATQATALATAGLPNVNDYEQYTLDANGNRTQLRRRDGQLIGYTYDAANRMTAKDMPGTDDDVTYGYDLRGLQRSALFPSGQGISSGWDKGGRQVSSTSTMGGVTRTISYGRDKDGNRTSVTHPDSQYFSYGYDYADRLTSIKENGTTQIAGVTFDISGRLQNLTRGAVPTDYGYDTASRIASMADNPGGTAQDVTTGFTYNAASQIRTRNRVGTAYTFTGYTNVNRGYTTNGLNQYSAVAGVTFNHDANGNLTYDGTTVYSYDAENRLIGASGGATSNSTTLAYDPLGRLWQVTRASVTTRFLYDGDELIAEYDGSNALLRRYVHSGGDDDPLVWYEGSGVAATNRRSLVADYQGSIMSVADSAGNVIASNGYDEYGIPNGYVGTGTPNLGRFQYTGQIWLAEIGMYHYKARLYSPTLGRFLQTDPVGYKDQINLYAYVGNDPIDSKDPTGLKVDASPEFRAIIDEIAKTDPEFARRLSVMEKSTHVATLLETADGHAAHTTGKATNPYDISQIGKDNILRNSSNGFGTSVDIWVPRSDTILGGQGLGGTNLLETVRALIVHEFFAHAYDYITGTVNYTIDPNAPGSAEQTIEESRAIDLENFYRRIVGESGFRVRHNPSEDGMSREGTCIISGVGAGNCER